MSELMKNQANLLSDSLFCCGLWLSAPVRMEAAVIRWCLLRASHLTDLDRLCASGQLQAGFMQKQAASQVPQFHTDKSRSRRPIMRWFDCNQWDWTLTSMMMRLAPTEGVYQRPPAVQNTCGISLSCCLFQSDEQNHRDWIMTNAGWRMGFFVSK